MMKDYQEEATAGTEIFPKYAGFFYSSMWQKPIKKPIIVMHHDGVGGYFLTFPFLNAENDAYMVTVKNSTHGNFMDYNEIMAENIVSKTIIGGEEVELAMLGEISPDKMETIMIRCSLIFSINILRVRILK